MAVFGGRKEGLVLLAMIPLFCWSCVGPNATGQRAGEGVSHAAGEDSSVKTPPPLPIRKADQVLNVTVEEAGRETIIKLTGSGPFQDYQFRRIGDNQFELEIRDVTSNSSLPSLPAPCSSVSLDYSSTGPGMRLIGTLSTPLDRHVLNIVENDLVLTLYLSQETPLRAIGKGSKQVVASKQARARSAASSVPTRQTSGGQSLVATVAHSTGSDPATGSGLFTKTYTGKPISLDLLDADLKNVLRLISDITGTNIVIEPDVAGRVTLKVEQVPWDQVLDMVLSMNGLGQERVGNVIRIAKQATLKKEWDNQKETIKAKQDLMEAAKDLGELTTAYLTVNYAQPAEIAAKISENKSDKGKISVDARTSLIIYYDYPGRIEGARQLVSRLDKAAQQVLIESRIVTITSSSSRDLGITWSMSTQRPAASGSTESKNFEVNVPAGAASTFGMSIGEMIGRTFLQLDAEISALETARELKVIAAPRVLTIDNVKAKITQGTQIPYLVLNDSGVTSTEFKDATVELTVTPHITPDHKVRLEIAAKQDEPGASINGQASIDKREITTELLVDDGNIIVIGGVIRDRKEKTWDGTPGLNRVPILGRFFKSDGTASEKTELLIFISPKIVQSKRMPEAGSMARQGF